MNFTSLLSPNPAAHIMAGRRLDLDVAQGILLCNMMFHHLECFNNLYILGEYHKWPLYFFMAWFFFKAGMLWQPRELTRSYVLKSADRLLIPYVVLMPLGYLLHCLRRLSEGYEINFHQFVYEPIYVWGRFGAIEEVGPVWCLLTLFCVRMLAARYIKDDRSALRVAAVALVPLVVWRATVGTFFAIPLNIPMSVILFCAGYLLKEKQYDWRLWLPSLGIYLCFMLFGFTLITYLNFSVTFGASIFYWCIALIPGCIFFNVACHWVCRWKVMKPFAAIGRDSMSYLTLHMPVWFIAYAIAGFAGLPTHLIWLNWALIAFGIVVFPFLVGPYKRTIGSMSFQPLFPAQAKALD